MRGNIWPVLTPYSWNRSLLGVPLCFFSVFHVFWRTQNTPYSGYRSIRFISPGNICTKIMSHHSNLIGFKIRAKVLQNGFFSISDQENVFQAMLFGLTPLPHEVLKEPGQFTPYRTFNFEFFSLISSQRCYFIFPQDPNCEILQWESPFNALQST